MSIVGLGINRIAKNISGVETDPLDGLNHLKELSEQKNAEDKQGAFTASVELFIISLCIASALYSMTLITFECPFLDYYTKTRKEMSARVTGRNVSKEEQENAKNAFDRLLDRLFQLIKYGPFGVGGGLVCYHYVKKKRKAGKQREMEKALEEEMNRLKEALQKEAEGENTTSAAGVTDNTPSILKGVNIVELFNSFAMIMGLQKNLPREKDETALEYFTKISDSLNFPKSESLKASKYFDDELYGKKESTSADRAAFMKLLLNMMTDIETHRTKLAA